MVDIDRGIVSWSGTGLVGSGVSVFYATPGGAVMNHLKTFFSAIAGWLPSTVTISFPTTGDTIDDTTGHLVGSWSGAVNTPVTGGANTPYSNRAGVAVGWLTNVIVPPGGIYKTSHRVKGRTFLVPLAGTIWDSADGTLSGAGLSSLNTSATALISNCAGHLQVWHRPSPGGSDGRAATVLSCRIKDHSAALLSRSV